MRLGHCRRPPVSCGHPVAFINPQTPCRWRSRWRHTRCCEWDKCCLPVVVGHYLSRLLARFLLWCIILARTTVALLCGGVSSGMSVSQVLYGSMFQGPPPSLPLLSICFMFLSKLFAGMLISHVSRLYGNWKWIRHTLQQLDFSCCSRRWSPLSNQV